MSFQPFFSLSYLSGSNWIYRKLQRNVRGEPLQPLSLTPSSPAMLTSLVSVVQHQPQSTGTDTVYRTIFFFFFLERHGGLRGVCRGRESLEQAPYSREPDTGLNLNDPRDHDLS